MQTDSEMQAVDLPIKGMKLTPSFWGEPMMSGAYLSHLYYILGEEWARAEFKKDTGHDLDRVLFARGIEKMVDQATGHDQSTVAAFADWVTENYWGIDGQEPPKETA